MDERILYYFKVDYVVFYSKEGQTKLSQNMSDEATNAGNIQLSGVQVALGWNRPDFAEKLLNSDSATKDEKALGSILMHALVSFVFSVVNDDLISKI